MTAEQCVEMLRAIHAEHQSWYPDAPGAPAVPHTLCRGCGWAWPCQTRDLLDTVP